VAVAAGLTRKVAGQQSREPGMSPPRIVHALFPELLLTPAGFAAGLGVLLEDDRIACLLPHRELRSEVERRRSEGQYVTSRGLAGKALLPGLVNTHSHAFQRGIRGRTEFPGRQREDFWSWRAVMYETASRLTPEDVEALALGVYVEMVKAGITHVGEFHYLHHQPDGRPYQDPDELAWRVLRAGRGAGLRVTMLRAFYQRAGVGRPEPEGAQLRFCDPDLEFYLASLARLAESGCPVAITAHSVRAVPQNSLARLVEVAAQRGWPLHLHISEQQREVEECLQEYGCRPVELLQRLGGLTSSTTLVHAIHLSPAEIAAIGQAGCSIASCPTTERNLGDGIVPAEALLRAGAHFTFGSDSQCQIAPFEDARQLEYHRRLQAQARSLLFAREEEAGGSLLEMLTVNGWRSLGGEGGRIAVGQPSDLIAVDLEHLSLAGTSAQSLALDLVFSAAPEAVRDVWISGVEVVCDGHHRAEQEAFSALRRVMARLRQG
jgi:formimidoylglutamate deiminase